MGHGAEQAGERKQIGAGQSLSQSVGSESQAELAAELKQAGKSEGRREKGEGREGSPLCFP